MMVLPGPGQAAARGKPRQKTTIGPDFLLPFAHSTETIGREPDNWCSFGQHPTFPSSFTAQLNRNPIGNQG